jgi:CheY-like chemotaxis protein
MKERMIQTSKLDSIGIFAGGIAHDFNNFLTSLLGCLGLVKRDSAIKDGSVSSKYINDAESIVYRARGLTEQLLTFSKGGEPVKKVMSIAGIIRTALDFILSGTNLDYECNIADDLFYADVDESQIMQVVNNLIINAVQAMPEGGTIRIDAFNSILDKNNRFSLPEGIYVALDVKDAGPGINPELLSNIFDPFFTTKDSGTGLGLSVAHSIITKHGGIIYVENSAEGGAVFSILIPAVADSPDYCDDEERSKSKFSGRVLLMDDDEMIRQVGENLLSGLGLEVVTASNGEEALSAFKEYRNLGIHFDVVILDLTIKGGIGGRKTFEALRRIEPGIKAIVSSGYSGDSLMSEYRDFGFKGVLRKPYTIEELSITLDSVINGC